MSSSFDSTFLPVHLPIFPLPLVLLPYEVLPLHIFEERYRQLMADIGPEGGRFGITLLEPAGSFIDRPDIGTVGCVAEIKAVTALPDGRYDIVTTGIKRYRLVDHIDSDKPYLVGRVEYFEDEPEAEVELRPLADQVFELLERIAKAAFKMNARGSRFPEVPRLDAQAFSFLATVAFNFDNELRYGLLEMSSTSSRLEKLRELFSGIVGQVEENVVTIEASRSNGHSKKKLDI